MIDSLKVVEQTGNTMTLEILPTNIIIISQKSPKFLYRHFNLRHGVKFSE